MSDANNTILTELAEEYKEKMRDFTEVFLALNQAYFERIAAERYHEECETLYTRLLGFAGQVDAFVEDYRAVLKEAEENGDEEQIEKASLRLQDAEGAQRIFRGIANHAISNYLSAAKRKENAIAAEKEAYPAGEKASEASTAALMRFYEEAVAGLQ